MGSNYQRQYEKDYANLIIEKESLEKELKRTNAYLSSLEKSIATLAANNDKLLNSIKEKDEIINMLMAKVNELTILVDKLLKQNNKDSSNSSKPSSTNGSKKVITNRREKSNKKPGGQLGHVGHVLKIKQVEKMIKSGKFEYQIINNEDNNTSIKYVIDIDAKLIIKENKNYKGGLNSVIYGENIKSLAVYLMINNYSSTDNVCKFFEVISDGNIKLSKGTLINWLNEFSNNSQLDLETIKAKLMTSYYTNNDDSQIKINGENYNQIVCCNADYTYLAIDKHKNKEAVEKIGILPGFNGISVKDGANLYSKYGSKASQCLSHILRYLKGAYEENNRLEAKKIADYLSSLNDERNKLIASNTTCFKDEENLLIRMKGKHKEEILYFIHDFKIPSTNNQAEVDQRGIKIKQKIGKFRSVDGAINYAKTKSIILTAKKQNINIFTAIKNIFKNKSILKKAIEI